MMTIFKNKYQARKALMAKNSNFKYKILKYKDGYIVAFGLLSL